MIDLNQLVEWITHYEAFTFSHIVWYSETGGILICGYGYGSPISIRLEINKPVQVFGRELTGVQRDRIIEIVMNACRNLRVYGG